MSTEYWQLKNKKVPLKIYYEKRKNARVSIGKHGINIRLPVSLSPNEKEQQIAQFKLWVQQQLNKKPQLLDNQPRRHYNQNDLFKVGKITYQLKLSYKDKKSCSAKLEGEQIIISLSTHLSEEKRNKSISTLISRVIAKNRLRDLEQRIHHLNNQYFNQKINRISFKNTLSRWGSCSSKGNINISTRLLFAPDDVFDYVCLHELAHLIENNHSLKFWHLVEKAIPDYKKKRQWLRENGAQCYF